MNHQKPQPEASPELRCNSCSGAFSKLDVHGPTRAHTRARGGGELRGARCFYLRCARALEALEAGEAPLQVSGLVLGLSSFIPYL